MAVYSKIGSMSPAESPWTKRVAENGTVNVVQSKVGATTEVVSWANGFTVGNYANLNKSESCPFSGRYKITGISVSVGIGGIATCEVTYSIPYGDEEGTDENATELDLRETLDVTPLEKPIDSAPFWDNTEGSTRTNLEALKKVQAYIDAPDETEAETIRADMSEREKTMAEKRLAGVEAYIVPAPQISRTYETKTAPNVGKVGVISTPNVVGVPVPDGYQWLRNGWKIEWSRGTGIYSVTESWLGANVWDTDLYGNETT